MLKFVKHTMDSDGIEIYPIVSLSIFFVVFVAYFIYAMTYKKETIKELSELPFKDNLIQ